jgi:hypoxanthine phosphoribosyltransferase
MELESRFSTEDIAAAVDRVAGELSAAYPAETPLMVGVLTGSFVFLADLVRAMSIEVEIDFIRARSYGKGTVSSGAVEITKDIEHDVTGRSVILVEDILDTGLTLDFVADRVRAGHPAEVKTCSLLVREGATPPDYMGLWIPGGFVVGYGIDYAERFRGLPDIKSVPGT